MTISFLAIKFKEALMKQIILKAFLFSFLFALIACVPGTPATSLGNFSSGNNNGNSTRDDGDSSRGTSSSRFSTPNDTVTSRDTSSNRDRDRGDCSDEKDCEEICEDIYEARSAQKDCEELSVSEVEDLEEVYKALKDPDFEDELEALDLDSLKTYINIDEAKQLHEFADDWSSRDVKEILEWIASSEEVTSIFKDADEETGGSYGDFKIEALNKKNVPEKVSANDDYDLIINMLGKIDGKIGDALVSSASYFFEKAIEEDNEELLKWVHDLIDEQGAGVLIGKKARGAAIANTCYQGRLDHPSCLKLYCSIAKKMDDDLATDLLEIDYFRSYIEEVIEDEINKPEWDKIKVIKRIADEELDTDEIIEDILIDDEKWWEVIC